MVHWGRSGLSVRLMKKKNNIIERVRSVRKSASYVMYRYSKVKVKQALIVKKKKQSKRRRREKSRVCGAKGVSIIVSLKSTRRKRTNPQRSNKKIKKERCPR